MQSILGLPVISKKPKFSGATSQLRLYTSIIVFGLVTLFSCKTSKLAEAPLKKSDHIHPDRCLLTINTTGDSLSTLFLAYNSKTNTIDTFTNIQQVEGCLGIDIKNVLACDCVQELVDATADSTKSVLQSGYANGLYAYRTKDRTTFGFDTPIYIFSRTGSRRKNEFPASLDSTQLIGVFTQTGMDLTSGVNCDTAAIITYASVFQQQKPWGDIEEDYVSGQYLTMLHTILTTNRALKTAGEISSAISSRRIPDSFERYDLYDLPDETRKKLEIEVYNNAGTYWLNQHGPAMQALQEVAPEYIDGVLRYQEGCPGQLDRFDMQGMNMREAAERLPGIVAEYQEVLWPDSTYIPPVDTILSPQSCFSTSMNGPQSFTIHATCDGVSFMIAVFDATGVNLGSIENITDGSTVHIQNILKNQVSGIYYVQIVAFPSGEIQVVRINK